MMADDGQRLTAWENRVDADRLGELVDRHAAALELYAAQWTRAPEDCVQEAFIELVRQPRAPANVAAWLYRVVRNRAINAARGERRRERHEQAAAMEFAARLDARQSAGGVEAEEVAAALGRLERLHREVIVLRVWSGLTLEEIAAIVGCGTSTVHRRYHDALDELRRLLEKSECPETTHCP